MASALVLPSLHKSQKFTDKPSYLRINSSLDKLTRSSL